jgi:molybdopterin converting factor small subunit
MQVKVIAFGELTEILGKEFSVDLVKGDDLSALLTLLEEKSGSEKGYLGSYRLKDEVAILVNGRSIHLLQGVKTRLMEGDTVYLLLLFAGG